MLISSTTHLSVMRFMLLLSLLNVSLCVGAQQDISLEDDLRPVWEAGMFMAGFNTPEYPAAEQNQTNLLAAPYFVYRGETLRIGDGAIARAVAVDKRSYELDLSLAGSFNAKSDDNQVRDGMPDLDFMFEIGPQLRLQLAKFEFDQQGKGQLFLNLQTRAAFSTDFSGIAYRGYVFQPQLAYRQRGWLSEKTALSVSLSPTWASEQLQDYLYQVSADFATAQRPVFDARAGYMGTKVAVSLAFDASNSVRVFIGVNLDMQFSAANKLSPLYSKQSTFSVAAGLVWRLYASDQMVTGR